MIKKNYTNRHVADYLILKLDRRERSPVFLDRSKKSDRYYRCNQILLVYSKAVRQRFPVHIEFSLNTWKIDSVCRLFRLILRPTGRNFWDQTISVQTGRKTLRF